MAYSCSSPHCKEDKEPAGTQVAGHGNAPKQTVPTSAHRKAEKRTKGGRKEGAIIWGRGGADGSDRIKNTKMDICAGTTFPQHL